MAVIIPGQYEDWEELNVKHPALARVFAIVLALLSSFMLDVYKRQDLRRRGVSP